MNFFMLAESTAQADPMWTYYAQNLRAGMFTGFLTLSSFLLTMTTFIVMNLKANYYDTDLYKNRFDQRRQAGSRHSYYRSLRNLGMVMLATIVLAFATSISQFTIGLHEARWSVYVCGGLAALTVLALGFNLFQIIQNMRVQFAAWENQKANST